jgi:hypothetical protein
MTNPATLLALAERCEQAAGPDRELDAEISVVVGRHETHVERRSDGTTKLLPWRGDGTGSYNIDCRRYTASLDAAVTLVPEGCGWMAMNNASKVGVWPSHGATPALALCAAALRARAAAI